MFSVTEVIREFMATKCSVLRDLFGYGAFYPKRPMSDGWPLKSNRGAEEQRSLVGGFKKGTECHRQTSEECLPYLPSSLFIGLFVIKAPRLTASPVSTVRLYGPPGIRAPRSHSFHETTHPPNHTKTTDSRSDNEPLKTRKNKRKARNKLNRGLVQNH